MAALITEALVLCGGRGTRLKSVVADRPKPMAQIGDKPFLDFIIHQLVQAGIKHILLCTGFMSEYIASRVDRWGQLASITVSVESEPLGTGGAIKYATSKLTTPTFLVLNGDSLCNCNLTHLINEHKKSKAKVTLALSHKVSASRFGTVECNQIGQVLAFREKQENASGLVNAGIYVFDKDVLTNFHLQAFSLENDMFPALCGKGLYGVNTGVDFIDIGTPDDYLYAQQTLGKLEIL